MSDLMLCYEKDCAAEQKFSENLRQFLKKGGAHTGHKVAYFDDLCEQFIQEFGQSQKKENEHSLMTDVQNMFGTFQKDFLVKIDLHSQNLQSFIQAKAIDDKRFQLYLSIVQKDLEKVKECASVFFMFDEPKDIQEAYTKNLNEVHDYIKNSQNMMNDIKSRIDPMNEQPSGVTKKRNESEEEVFINQLNHFQEQIHSIQNVSIIQVVEVLEAQQRVIKLLFDQLIKYNCNTYQSISHTNTKLEQHSLLVQGDIQQKYNTSFQEKLIILKETSNADFQKLIVKINIDSQQALDQNKITLNDLQVSLQKVQNELQASKQTLNERDGMINSLQSSLRELKQHQIKVDPLTKQVFSFSPQHQSQSYTITLTNILTKTGADGPDLAVMVPALDLTHFKCVTFGFKIKKNQPNLDAYAVGICHLDTIIQKNYSFSGYASVGHGCYMVALNDHTYSTIDSTINYKQKSFQSKTNDTIFCTVNPTNETITFKNSSSNESFVMGYQPTAEQLHPCVRLFYTDDQVEFIQPE